MTSPRRRDEGLYFEVWQSTRKPQQVAVAFRGTDFTSLTDWKANARWLTRVVPFYEDQYTVVSKKLSVEFRQELARRIDSGETERDAVVTSTGHSLGGGLAQNLPIRTGYPATPVPRPRRPFRGSRR